MYAPGSGLWIWLGNTRAYPEHRDGKLDLCNDKSVNWDQVSVCAQNQGVDSHQYLQHTDPQWYCYKYMTIEIVIVGLDGTTVCGGRADAYRAGWMASQKCDCEEKGS